MQDKQASQSSENARPSASEPEEVYSCLYVSQSNLTPPANRVELDKLLSSALPRNKGLDITGALLCTDGRFAQVLEGPEKSVKLLLDKIRADPRHRNFRIISESVGARQFSEWSMAYMGPSIYIDRHIKPLLQNLITQTQADEYGTRLIDLMVEQTRVE